MKMKAWPLAVALALGVAPWAQAADPVGYVAADGVNTVPVTAATPLPVTVAGQTGANASQVQGTAAAGATVAGNPVLVGGTDGTSAQTLLVQTMTNDLRSSSTVGLQTNSYVMVNNGSTWARQRSAAQAVNDGNAGTGVMAVEEAGRSFSNITTNATTTVKSSAGFLHTICVNTKGASANTATVYANTVGSGAKIATIDTTVALACQIYDIAFSPGLTVVTATETAADITVSYR